MKDYIINKTIPSLTLLNPLMIIEIIALCVMGLGIIMMTNEKHHWLNKISTLFNEQQYTDREKQYNDKKLNDEVFRKLKRILCLEYYPFFENKFGFCIPKDTQLSINESDRAEIAFNIQLGNVTNVEGHFNKMDDVITTLEVGEDYLQQNYTQIYNMWIQIKDELSLINKERQDFCDKVSTKIMDDLKKHIPTNPTFRLNPFGDGWAYFSDNVPRIIPSLFNKFGRLDLSMENPTDNQFYLVYGGYRILGSNKKESLNLEIINKVFNDVTHDDKFKDKHSEFQARLIKLNNKIDTFCKQLEKKVVNDIDNQI